MNAPQHRAPAIATVLALGIIGSLTGCTSTDMAPTPTPTAPAMTSAPSPSASPSPTPDSSAPEGPADGEPAFTTQVLASLCVDKTLESTPNAVHRPAEATSEWLDAPGLWFVVIPETIDGTEYVAFCGIKGTPDNPEFITYGGGLPGSEIETREGLLGINDEGKD